jgi:hypothetical protein
MSEGPKVKIAADKLTAILVDRKIVDIHSKTIYFRIFSFHSVLASATKIAFTYDNICAQDIYIVFSNFCNAVFYDSVEYQSVLV